MAASHIAGPSIVSGETGGSAGGNSDAGPSVTYQGGSILDVRTGYEPSVTGRGRIRAFMDSPYVAFVDAVPATAGAAKVAPAAAATSGAAMTLVTAFSAGIAPNTPVQPIGTPGVLKVLALDPGFVTVGTTSGSAVVTLSSANATLFARFQPGLTVAVAAGAAATWLLATVLSISGLNVTLDTKMGATVAAAPMALANGSGRNDETPTALIAFLTAGAAAVFDPRSGLTRGVSVTSNNAGDTGWTMTVRGYDVFGYAVTETIAVTPNGTAYGGKTFKYIASATPSKSGGGTTAGTLSVGTSDIFGFAMRSDAWEYMNIYWAGVFLSASTGWLAGDTTNPATGITTDTRGRIQVGATGPGSGAAGSADGVRRLTVYMTIPVDNLVMATSRNPTPLYGVTQFAG